MEFEVELYLLADLLIYLQGSSKTLKARLFLQAILIKIVEVESHLCLL